MLPYYRLLPVEGFTIYPQVTLVSNDSPPKHSSSKGFHIVLPLPPPPHPPPSIKCLSLIFIVCDISVPLLQLLTPLGGIIQQ